MSTKGRSSGDAGIKDLKKGRKIHIIKAREEKKVKKSCINQGSKIILIQAIETQKVAHLESNLLKVVFLPLGRELQGVDITWKNSLKKSLSTS